jgi:hypothetical protein
MLRRFVVRIIILTAVFILLLSSSAQACSVFVAADGNNVLSCSNEDGENGNTFMWFIPASPSMYGAVYFGYEDAWVQGGMNDKGLALDWATTEPQKMVFDNDRINPIGNKNRLYSGNLNEAILKTCATLDDVIALYGRYNEVAFENAHVLVADKSGASAVFEWHDGKFEVIKKTTSYQAITNFNITNAAASGYSCSRFDSIKGQLDHAPAVTLEKAKITLSLASDYLTQYSYMLDLKSGTIYLYDKQNFSTERVLTLKAELAKGTHIYPTALGSFKISDKYRSLNGINNQNPLATGGGKIEVIIISSLCGVFALLALLFARKSKWYILSAITNLMMIPLGLGLMQYGYFLRYGFTLLETLLSALPVLFIGLAAAQLVISIILLFRSKRLRYLPFYISTTACIMIAWMLLETVIF